MKTQPTVNAVAPSGHLGHAPAGSSMKLVAGGAERRAVTTLARLRGT